MPTKDMVAFETNLTNDEVREFYELCSRQGVCPAEKIGDLIHGFLLAEGVKHRVKEGRAA